MVLETGRSAAAPRTDHAWPHALTNDQVTGCALNFGHPQPCRCFHRWVGAYTAGRRDGNDDGNPGRRSRSRLNGDVRLISAPAVPSLDSLHLESERPARVRGFESLRFREVGAMISRHVSVRRRGEKRLSRVGVRDSRIRRSQRRRPGSRRRTSWAALRYTGDPLLERRRDARSESRRQARLQQCSLATVDRHRRRPTAREH
jgi:hypothetical protein